MTAQPTTTKTRPVQIPSVLTVKELGELTGVSGIEVIKRDQPSGNVALPSQFLLGLLIEDAQDFQQVAPALLERARGEGAKLVGKALESGRK